MTYKRYEYRIPLCNSCGMKPVHVGGAWLCDQFVCPSCDKKTASYYDGAEYALEEWCKMNGAKFEIVEVEDGKV